MLLRNVRFLSLSLLSGVILSSAWPERGFPGLLFIGLVPLLAVEDYIFSNHQKFIRFSALFYSLPGFLLWNLLTTWWIVNSTLVGAVLAIGLNSIFMSVVFQAYHWTRKKLKHPLAGYAAFISYWIAFEYLHLNWDLNWPWLNLGNGFASYYKWVQWYEYTGAMGGSVWILVGNVMIFLLIGKIKDQRSKIKTQNSKFVVQYSIFIFLWIALPLIFSYSLYSTCREEPRPVNFVVVQPNIDPYSEQYSLPPKEVVGKIMGLAGQALDSTTNFLIAPESAIQENMWENDLSTFASIRLLEEAIAPYPGLNMLVGGSTFYLLGSGDKPARWARKFTDTGGLYYAFNAAILLNNRDPLQLYHKSKLTPGVEILPSFKGFKWLENYAIDLGGTVGSLGMDAERKVYKTKSTVRVSPVICYESVFGEFFSEFVRNGAEIMVIITNDGWWGNTAGHRQHYAFAHLRAIETRRSIARSANTGISAFIDQRGDEHQRTAYWVPAVIKETLNANDRITFYTRHGDYIARFFSYLAGALFIVTTLISLKNKLLRRKSSPR